MPRKHHTGSWHDQYPCFNTKTCFQIAYFFCYNVLVYIEIYDGLYVQDFPYYDDFITQSQQKTKWDLHGYCFTGLSITSIRSSKTANSESVGKAVWFDSGLTYHDAMVVMYQLIHLKNASYEQTIYLFLGIFPWKGILFFFIRIKAHWMRKDKELHIKNINVYFCITKPIQVQKGTT